VHRQAISRFDRPNNHGTSATRETTYLSKQQTSKSMKPIGPSHSSQFSSKQKGIPNLEHVTRMDTVKSMARRKSASDGRLALNSSGVWSRLQRQRMSNIHGLTPLALKRSFGCIIVVIVRSTRTASIRSRCSISCGRMNRTTFSFFILCCFHWSCWSWF